MEALKIYGGRPLVGEFEISGSKNAALPIVAATLLTPGVHQIDAVPDLTDVRTMGRLIAKMGGHIEYQDNRLGIDTEHLDCFEAPYDLVRTMRASILVLGPLLARFGRARVSLPGGCAIGARPIDQHLKGLERLGANIELDHGYVVAETKGLVGAEIVFDMPTVGGTENLMLAASLAKGTTVLRNAAREPEIIDLACALTGMGVRIQGAGTQCIEIEGATSLKPMVHTVVADRIETGTFLVAGAMAGEPLTLVGGVSEHQAALIDKLRNSGATIDITPATDTSPEYMVVHRAQRPTPIRITTAPYPGFPTDMQAQLMAFLATGQGSSVIMENVFENRFMHVAELDRMGAHIRVDAGKAVVTGVPALSGAAVMATDLRASACLVLAGLVANGETIVRRIYHLDRGYERIGQKLSALGAKIERLTEAT